MPENSKSKNIAKSPQSALGVVVSDKMEKTVVVRIDSVTHHPVYRKVMRRSMKVKAHDEKNIAKIGDVVKISQTRPLSKDKRWKLAEVVEKA
jgi:small subunit ribosomal protein S17